MVTLVEPSHTKTGIGIRQERSNLEAFSNCCRKQVHFDHGLSCWVCSACRVFYRRGTDPGSSIINVYPGMLFDEAEQWIANWIGYEKENITLTVDF